MLETQIDSGLEKEVGTYLSGFLGPFPLPPRLEPPPRGAPRKGCCCWEESAKRPKFLKGLPGLLRTFPFLKGFWPPTFLRVSFNLFWRVIFFTSLLVNAVPNKYFFSLSRTSSFWAKATLAFFLSFRIFPATASLRWNFNSTLAWPVQQTAASARVMSYTDPAWLSLTNERKFVD